jgi:hypothetical protein
MPRRILIILIFSLLTLPSFSDPLQDEVLKWQSFVKTHESKSEDWRDFKPLAESILNRAEANLNAGRRYYAFYLLAAIRPHLASEGYLSTQPTEFLEQLSGLESEWKKWGATYQRLLSNQEKPDFTGVPAGFRALGEAAFSEIRPFYEASLEFGKATDATTGFYYLGSAQSQQEFVRFCEQFHSDPPPRNLLLPGLKKELDLLEDAIVENYHPPASMEQHPVFIRASALLKEARELYASGAYDGALLKMLDSRAKLEKMLHPGKSITPEEAQKRATEARSTLQEDQRDESIAKLFIEMAVAEASNQDPEAKGGETARTVFEDVLPHYFSALKTPKPSPPQPAPVATVTLVRWPYT